MIVHRVITYLTIALIAVQSVMAVADVHQLHQSGTKHLAFDHEHDQATYFSQLPQVGQEIKINARELY